MGLKTAAEPGLDAERVDAGVVLDKEQDGVEKNLKSQKMQ
jgi:hypothetical protein